MFSNCLVAFNLGLSVEERLKYILPLFVNKWENDTVTVMHSLKEKLYNMKLRSIKIRKYICNMTTSQICARTVFFLDLGKWELNIYFKMM